jgi:ribonuclease BN (tRNA processing enzyme)
MSRLRLLPLGIGNAFSAVSYSSCLALEADGRWLLIDCPHPILKMMREASLAAGVTLYPADVDAVALTHLHADHVSGLEGLAYYCYFFLHRRLELLAHRSVSEHLWSGHLSAGMKYSRPAPGGPVVERHFADYFDLHDLPDGRAVVSGPFAVSAFPATHSVPTTAFLVEAAGRTFGYSADTSYNPELIDWLSRADLIVHEANGDYPHTPYERLAALPEELRRKMLVIHYPDGFDSPNREVELLRQGQSYWV